MPAQSLACGLTGAPVAIATTFVVSSLRHVQASHDEAYAKCPDSKVGMKIEPHMVLKDDSGLVCYKLAVIIFRRGGLNDGHFYIAAPARSGMWRILNNQTAQEAMSLKQLQFSEGRHAHGLMYVRTGAPPIDDWGSLNTTGSASTLLHDVRCAAVCFCTNARQGSEGD